MHRVSAYPGAASSWPAARARRWDFFAGLGGDGRAASSDAELCEWSGRDVGLRAPPHIPARSDVKQTLGTSGWPLTTLAGKQQK